MKNILLLVFLSLAIGCTDLEFAPSDPKTDGYNSGGITPQFACDYTYKFNISQNSTYTQVLQNVKYDFHIKNKIVSTSSGGPIPYPTAITWISGVITFKVTNTGQSTIRYKSSVGGVWTTVLPGNFSTFIKPTYLKRDDCTAAITFLDFTVNTERVNCGTMIGNSNHFNAVIQITSITNGHNSDYSIIGVNTSSLVCPL